MTTNANKNRSTQVIVYVVVAFALFYITDEIFFNTLQIHIYAIIPNRIAAFIATYLLIGLPLFVATRLINQRGNILRNLGFMANPWIGLGFAAICTLPMFAGYAYMAGGLSSGLSVSLLLANDLAAGVFEETYFRGFLFGQLFRNTRLGFVPTIILCSVLFASVHLYQSADPKVLIGILSTTFLGSVLFAWLYVEWGYNIWIPMCLHSLMDISWDLFSAGPNALGGLGANVFRLVTVVLAISLTVLYKRLTKRRFIINRRTLWSKGTADKSAGALASDAF